jgi:predicted kinase
MRKWIRERSKRRKKPSETAAEAAPAPLQPAYFDAEPATPQPVSEPAETMTAPAAAEPETREPETSEPEMVEASPAQVGEAGARTDSPQRRRRRRGRGGRGRSRGSASAVASTAPPEAAAESVANQPQESAAKVSAAPPVPAPQAATRPPKGAVILAIGLPGSGKSSWFKRHNINPLSSDLLRVLLFDDATEQRFQDLIFSNLRSMLKARLIARRPLNYVDATNLTPHERHGWIKLAKDYGYEVQAVFFDVPVEVCLDRNQRRSRVVAEDVMRRMAAKVKPPTFEEGFSKITVVKVKQKE